MSYNARASRVDRNQPEIVDGLRKFGATVKILSAVGDGCPDILVGYNGKNYLMEIKDCQKPPSKRRLTDDQKKWHGKWKGQKCVVETIAKAVEILKNDGRVIETNLFPDMLGKSE